MICACFSLSHPWQGANDSLCRHWNNYQKLSCQPCYFWLFLQWLRWKFYITFRWDLKCRRLWRLRRFRSTNGRGLWCLLCLLNTYRWYMLLALPNKLPALILQQYCLNKTIIIHDYVPFCNRIIYINNTRRKSLIIRPPYFNPRTNKVLIQCLYRQGCFLGYALMILNLFRYIFRHRGFWMNKDINRDEDCCVRSTIFPDTLDFFDKSSARVGGG